MHIAAEHHHVLQLRISHGSQKPGAGLWVTVPAVGERTAAQRGVDATGTHLGGLGHQLPAFGAAGQPFGEPLLLRCTQHGAGRIGQRVTAHHHAAAAPIGVGAGLVVAVLAAVQRPQVGQLAPSHAVVDAHLARVGRVGPQSHRHVFKVGLIRRRPSPQEHLRIGVVAVQVIGVVVDHLVVVPGHHPGVGRVAGAQIGIRLVLRMALTVLMKQRGHATLVLAQHVLRVGAFVDVVAREQHQVQVALGDLAVGHVVALLVMLARRQRDAQAVHRVIEARAGAGAAHRAGG